MTDTNEPTISPRAYLLKAAWVVVRVLLVFYLGQPGVRFFYQGF